MKGQIDFGVVVDSRRFLFGPTMAIELGTTFVSVREKMSNCLEIAVVFEYALVECGNATAAVDVQMDPFEKKQRVKRFISRRWNVKGDG